MILIVKWESLDKRRNLWTAFGPMFTGVRFKCVGPHHDLLLFRISRFPILGFRIPKSVWRMGILEYRTMRLRDRGGAHGLRGGRGRATGGIGHRMSYANSGVRHWMSWGGSWLPSERSWRGTMGKGRGTKGDRH